MILVISNWKRKLMYFIFLGIVIITLATLFSSEGGETVSGSQIETESQEEGEIIIPENSGGENSGEEGSVEKSEETLGGVQEGEAQGWLKSIINKFKEEK